MTTAVRARRRTAVLASAAIAALAGGVLIVTLRHRSAPPLRRRSRPASTYTVVNLNSGKCVDARAAGTANGTAVQQYTCNGTTAQQLEVHRDQRRLLPGRHGQRRAQVWDDTNVSTADGSPIQLWLYGGGNNQQWLPVAESSGTYHFVNRFSGKCLDVPSASTADSVQLQQYACNGTARAVVLAERHRRRRRPRRRQPEQPGPRPERQDLRPVDVERDDPEPARHDLQRRSSPTSSAPSGTRCCSSRAPTTSSVQRRLLHPGRSGSACRRTTSSSTAAASHADAALVRRQRHPELLARRWRTSPITRRRARSSTRSRRPRRCAGCTCRATWCSTTTAAGPAAASWPTPSSTARSTPAPSSSGCRATTQFGSWTGSNWNMVFVGDTHAPAQSFPSPPYTTVGSDAGGRARSRSSTSTRPAPTRCSCPALRTNCQRHHLGRRQPGRHVAADQPVLRRQAGDTAATINAALAAGQEPAVHAGRLPPDQTPSR